MNELDGLNYEQQLYVLKCGKGYTCLGFQVAFLRAISVANWLRVNGQEAQYPSTSNVGTKEGFLEYSALIKQGQEYSARSGNRCAADLIPQLVGLEGKRVEVFDKDGIRRRFWVGKSSGWFPTHLELANVRSSGGSPVDGAPFVSVRVIR